MGEGLGLRRRTRPQILITANSPGEVSGWVRPFLSALRRLEPEAEALLAVPPCPFATGREQCVLAGFPGVRLVLGPREVISLLVRGRWPQGVEGVRPRAVLFLGGDMLWAALLGWRLGIPALAYTEGLAVGTRFFQRLCVPDAEREQALRRRGVPAGKLAVVGDLMASAVEPMLSSAEAARFCRVEPERGPVVAFFPGSRPYELRRMLTFYLAVGEELLSVRPEAQPVFSIAPFLTRQELLAALDWVDPEVGGSRGELSWEEGGWWLRTPRARFPMVGLGDGTQTLRPQYEVMQVADLALTIPGTNTMELAVLGTPMLVVGLTIRLEEIPVEGLLGLITRIPPLYPWGKRVLLRQIVRRTRFLSLPNRVSGEPLVPELRGVLSPREVAGEALALLQDKARRERMRTALARFGADRAAAERLARLTLSVMGEEK